MSFTALLIHTVTVFNPAGNPEPDRYGNPTDELDEGTDYPARVQQTGTDETIPQRDTTITTFKVFLPANAVVTTLSVIDFESLTYRVNGDPWVVDGRYGPHHIELDMELVEG